MTNLYWYTNAKTVEYSHRDSKTIIHIRFVS